MTRRRADTVWMIAAFVLSGNPAVNAVPGGLEVLLPAFAVVLGLVAVARRASVLSPRAAWIVAAFIVIQVAQCFAFDFWPIVTILGMMTRLFVAAALVAVVSDFPAVYVRAIVIIAGYCLVMWIIDQTTAALHVDFRALFSPLEDALDVSADHRFTGVYTFTVLEGTYRNAGIFREPGLFAGYLLLGLLWLMLDHDAATARVRRRRILILLATLATTFSTAGYVTLPFVLVAIGIHPRVRSTRTRSRTPIVIAALVASLTALWLISENSTFLQDKLESQYDELMEEGKNYELTRFGGAVLDLEAIEERPYFGWGLHESTRFAQTPELAELAPSGGVTGWGRSFGIAGLVVFVLAISAGLRLHVGGRIGASIYLTAVVVLIAQPNTFLNYPMILGLLFVRPPAARPAPTSAVAEPQPPPAERAIHNAGSCGA